MPVTAWRIEIEQKAISSISQSFTANVIRPSLLYGGSGSLIGDILFASAKGGDIVWFGDENARMATIHKEDLGEAFRLCAEKVSAIHLRKL
jgi:nucleoside-diphosphate-sugar epimerase